MLRDEGKIIPKKTDWSVVRKYKEHGMLSRLPGSGRQPKVTEEVLALVESKMQSDDETTAVNLVAHLKDNGFSLSKTSVVRARRLLGWTYRGSSYCQLIRHANKAKRVAWAQQYLNDSFEDVIWTDESRNAPDKHFIQYGCIL
jgi:transposase